jgi:DNA repair ATPase RecN
VLQRIEIRNFQSLGSVDIPLGQFTVITGPTGSGKSGTIRAVRMLARNARGTGYITTGETVCSVSAGDGTAVVRITRSRGRGKDAYLVATYENGTWQQEKYTKLAGQVPEQAQAALGLTDLNFAGQFDPPYLLNVPGTQLAQTLGELTNVSLVLTAAAEANRRRKRFDRDLEAARERSATLLAESVAAMTGLAERRKAVQAAEEALSRLGAASVSLSRLEALTARLRAAQGTAASARAEAARQEPPSLQRLEDLAARLQRLEDLAARLRAAQQAGLRCTAQAAQAGREAQAAADSLHTVLARAGQCPTCGSTIT